MKNESKPFEELFKSYRRNKRLLERAEKISENLSSAKELATIEYVNPYLMSATTKIKVVGEYRG